MPKFKKNIIIRGEIELKTGLHIGGLKETVEIGGIDNPVITTYANIGGMFQKIPYIPGSTLKGKMRALLELAYAEITAGEHNSCGEGYIQVGNSCVKYDKEEAKNILKMFGKPAKSGTTEENISRLIFRDALPTEDTIKEWSKHPELVGGTEVKAENTVNRITSVAMPRFFERIPASSRFKFEILLAIYDSDDENKLVKLLAEGLQRLENSYIGGMGSRGYGKIAFHIESITERGSEFYKGNGTEIKRFEGGTVDEWAAKVGANN